MNKEELKSICDDLADEIISESSKLTQGQINQNLMKFSSDGEKISTAGMAKYCINESQRFTEKLLYSVLCKVLDIR